MLLIMSPIDKSKIKKNSVRRAQSLPCEPQVGGLVNMLPGCKISTKDCLEEVIEDAFREESQEEQQQQQQQHHSSDADAHQQQRDEDVQRGEKEKPRPNIVFGRDDSQPENVDSMDEFDIAEKASQGIEYEVSGPPLGSQDVVISIPANQVALWDQAFEEANSVKPSNDGVVAPPSPRAQAAAAASSAATARSIALDADKIHDRSLGAGMERHNFPVICDEDLQHNSQPPNQVPSFGSCRITIPEMVLPPALQHHRSFDVTGDALEFVLVARREETDDWYIPDMQVFADVINMVQMRILEKNMRLGEVLFDTKNWGGVGVMLLRVACPISLARWRVELTKVEYNDREYNSFPKNSLQARNNQVSMLLRDGLRYFRLEWLAVELKKRNSLKGKITVVFSKVYGIKEKTRLGASKYGWRLVIANVDEVFLQSVKAFPPGHGFKVGASTVLIRQLSSDYMPIIPPDSAASKIVQMEVAVEEFQPRQQQPMAAQIQQQLQRQRQDEDLLPNGLSIQSQRGPLSGQDHQQQQQQHVQGVPDLLMSITSPIPPDQARVRAGPGSRGGHGRRARDAASAAARRAYNGIRDL